MCEAAILPLGQAAPYNLLIEQYCHFSVNDESTCIAYRRLYYYWITDVCPEVTNVLSLVFTNSQEYPRNSTQERRLMNTDGERLREGTSENEEKQPRRFLTEILTLSLPVRLCLVRKEIKEGERCLYFSRILMMTQWWSTSMGEQFELLQEKYYIRQAGRARSQ